LLLTHIPSRYPLEVPLGVVECENETMDSQAPSDGLGTITIVRRTVWQDLVRTYTVFVDGEPVGRARAFQTVSFSVSPGPHRVRLAMPTTGTASSDEIPVDVPHGVSRVLRTHGRGLRKNITLPIATVIAVWCRATGRPFETRWYKRPWIILQVED
jgi:hypothetical protein